MERESDIYTEKGKMESVAIPEHLIKLLHVAQPGAFDLVGYVIYDVEGKPYQSIFYNGTIEVVEPGGLLSCESVFLLTLGIALLLLLGLWAYIQVQRLTKKTKNVSKVEVGTRFTDASRVARGTFGKTLSGSKRKKN